jgi:hypothetical protein
MLELFWKISFIIIAINAMFFFAYPSPLNSNPNVFAWLPTGEQNGIVPSTAAQSTNLNIFPSSDTNATIYPNGGASVNAVPGLSMLQAGFSGLFSFLFYILFGYFIWMQVMGIPSFIILIIGALLTFIQLFGLYYFISGFVQVVGMIFAWIIGAIARLI